MKIYKPSMKKYYEFFNIKGMNYEDTAQINESLVPLKESWKVKELSICNSGKCKKADVAFCQPYLLLLGQKLYDEIQEIFLQDEVEILPVSYNEEMFYMPRALKAYEVGYDLTYVENEFSFVYYFDKYKLTEQGINEKYFLRAETKGGIIVTGTYYTDKFIHLLEQKKVKGIGFDLIWDSEV